MPSSPSYVRDYARERETAKARGELKDNAARKRARYAMEKAGKAKRHDGKDVGHVTALSKGGSNSMRNLAMQDPAENRSFARSKSGAMKSERSKKEASKK